MTIKCYYFLHVSAVILFSLCLVAYADIDYNTINEDGSFRFRHTNDDLGSFYHTASSTADNTVRGRYGSRNPATGQVEETVYTAGPRGFRVNGPNVHRKMNVAQYLPRPVGSPDDPLADPFDDPSYSFSYANADQSRSENSDSTGRVRGLYSYLDDEGVRHSVRYAAGAGTGFEVTNSVPDNPIDVGYTGPLYKAPPSTRGKMTVQRGPDGAYKLISSGPDQRRAESRSSDGLVRGTYSFLDDKGVQRTVEYIAGAGIGYRVVKNRIGPGTHVNDQVLDFRLNDGDFKLASDFGTGAGPRTTLAGASNGGSRGKVGGATNRRDYLKPNSNRKRPSQNAHDDENDNNNTNNVVNGDDVIEDDDDLDDNSNRSIDTVKMDRKGIPNTGRGNTRHNGGSKSPEDRGYMYDRGTPRKPTRGKKPLKTPTNSQSDQRTSPPGSKTKSRRPSGSGSGGVGAGAGASGVGGGYIYDSPSNNNFAGNDDDISSSLPPLVTANHQILEIDRERDWVERNRDSTIIKNVGKWYLGLPPGQSVRAHVQNIDIIPLGGRRVPSPSEALRQDEIADMVASMESEKLSYTS